MKLQSRPMKILLVFVLSLTIWPVFLALKPAAKFRASGAAVVTLTSTNAVPIIIAASFTRITDDNNNLIFSRESDGRGGSRERIYALIGENPGIHFREICRQLEKEIGVVQYHVYVLKKFGMVSTMRDGRYNRYFVKDPLLDEKAQMVICSWLRPVEMKILSMLYGSPTSEMVTKDLVSPCAVTMQAISWHLKRLSKMELVSFRGKNLLVLPTETREKIETLLEYRIIDLVS
ncbi:MAG: winged helix-turn-helix transcriptional regulator [Promethearchaeota archaeon]